MDSNFSLVKSRIFVYYKNMNERNWGGSRKGAGRKVSGSDSTTVSLSLTKEQADMLRLFASEENKTVSQFIVEKLHLPKTKKNKYEKKKQMKSQSEELG